jgi:hypothetical protein
MLDIDWKVDGRGRIVAPLSIGFGLAVLQAPMIAVQLRCEEPAVLGPSEGRRLQFQISAVGARELAAALLLAALTVEDAPEAGMLN